MLTLKQIMKISRDRIRRGDPGVPVLRDSLPASYYEHKRAYEGLRETIQR
jgi:hypothetical protein